MAVHATGRQANRCARSYRWPRRLQLALLLLRLPPAQIESEDAMVKVAAAVGCWELGLHGAGLLEVLATGATSDDL